MNCRELGASIPGGLFSNEQIRSLVLELRDIAKVLATADPKLKQEVYRELGVGVGYEPHRRVVSVTDVRVPQNVSEDFEFRT